jgi:hypothetical protein
MNWDSVLIVLAVLAFIALLALRKQWGLLDRILFSFVTWAEREYGSGTGALKLAAVLEKVYPHVPAIIRIFVPVSVLEKMIDKALADAKERWESNPKLIESAS